MNTQCPPPTWAWFCLGFLPDNREFFLGFSVCLADNPGWLRLQHGSRDKHLVCAAQPSPGTDRDERDCLASVVISVLTSLYAAFPIYQLLNQQRGVWMVIIINIALGHCSSPFHGFLCILINVTPAGKIPQRYPECLENTYHPVGIRLVNIVFHGCLFPSVLWHLIFSVGK